MEKETYTLDGYSFIDENQYEEARQEKEGIEYIKSRTDLSNHKRAYKLYISLIEKGNFRTIIGYNFLTDLRNYIIEQGIVSEEDLLKVVIRGEELPSSAEEYVAVKQEEHEAVYKKLISDYKVGYRNSRIINIALVVIIIIMIAISVKSDRTVFKEYKNSVIDEYASWEEDLKARETAIKELEEKNK